MKKFINYNGKIFNDGDSVLPAANRSYRYGDGLFETMKLVNGEIILADLHFERLMGSLQILKIELPKLITTDRLKKEISELCEKNDCFNKARIRLSVSRGNGGLYDDDHKFQYMIECWPLEESSYGLNENGLFIDIYPDARKSIDLFSNLKSANYLTYVMAAIWAKENKLNDALVLNTHERICDATIANIFWAKDETVFTTPLSEGSVAGVMRNYVCGKIPQLGLKVKEGLLTMDELLQADEVFLTNAISGIRWVKQFRNKIYFNSVIRKIYNELIKTLH